MVPVLRKTAAVPSELALQSGDRKQYDDDCRHLPVILDDMIDHSIEYHERDQHDPQEVITDSGTADRIHLRRTQRHKQLVHTETPLECQDMIVESRCLAKDGQPAVLYDGEDYSAQRDGYEELFHTFHHIRLESPSGTVEITRHDEECHKIQIE